LSVKYLPVLRDTQNTVAALFFDFRFFASAVQAAAPSSGTPASSQACRKVLLARVCETASGVAIWRSTSLRMAATCAGSSSFSTRSRADWLVFMMLRVEEMMMNSSRHRPMLRRSLCRMDKRRSNSIMSPGSHIVLRQA
jgi:hypothetical protein